MTNNVLNPVIVKSSREIINDNNIRKSDDSVCCGKILLGLDREFMYP
ncbi:MAG: hypothetical protein QW725_00410 [Ignisphaera sp.]